mgnify:CR=1 FL=1
MTWRDQIRPIVATIISEAKLQGLDLKQTRKALRDNKPGWVGTEHWPYKVWCSECRIQLGLRPKLWAKQLRAEKVNPDQLHLEFE